MSDKISKVFDIDPDGVIKETLPTPFDGDKGVTDDAEFARSNLKQLIKTGQSALEDALNVARQSESPRAYEVLSTFLNTVASLNQQLMDIHTAEKKMSIERQKMLAPGSEPTKSVTNNNVIFTGTTSDLQDIIMKRINNAKAE